jgi:hypothetical protein
VTPLQKTRVGNRRRVDQGDIVKDIAFTEYTVEDKGVLLVSDIIFPLCVVLSPACDLDHDYGVRVGRKGVSPRKLMISVLVAPMYNADHLYAGTHLKDIEIECPRLSAKRISQNEDPRYHHLAFPDDEAIVDQVVDFKHYFTVGTQYMIDAKRSRFACRLSTPYREDLSQRFAAWLSRIGLP